MSDHIKQIAARMRRDATRSEVIQSLRIVDMPDGRFLGLCKTCPKKTRDRRFNSHAFSSSHMADTAEEIVEWFVAHRLTDIHTYYRNDPPMREPSAEEKLLAQIFTDRDPRPVVVPFKYARRYR